MPTLASTTGLKSRVLCVAILAAAWIPRMAVAALGEPELTVQTDVAQLRGSINTTEHAGYRLHEILLPMGTRVREFAGLDGKVFAVAWSGPTLPNLRQTLGPYFDTYVTAVKLRRGRGPIQIQQSGFVVRAAGHMRDFSGVAYLPAAVPGGVNVQELH